MFGNWENDIVTNVLKVMNLMKITTFLGKIERGISDNLRMKSFLTARHWGQHWCLQPGRGCPEPQRCCRGLRGRQPGLHQEVRRADEQEEVCEVHQ